ncbi:IMPACT family protein [Halobacteria archaeon AArc-m2/3/4]|uniref:IMPACT family protein n=1 Tax=Natronoglomus mannanivorans TaxID=2979990 RepID=A0ABT2QBT8_9EURY|nr:IMPACT family protein [Halobacteria archaeon AArc-m2/3/4]
MTDTDTDTDDTYTTLATDASASFVVQGSEFIGHARPVETVADAEAFVTAIEEEYDDATHNVPAYRVRADAGGGSRDGGGSLLREYSSDDGEPSSSAGKPALNVLAQRDLENCVVVVTRYYGGTNLGVGGLVRAYSRAVKEAVDAAGVVERRPHEAIAITVEYDDSGTVRGILESEGYEFDATYEAAVSFEVRVPVAEAAAFRDRIRSATSGRADLE